MDRREYNEAKRRRAQELLWGRCYACGEKDWRVLEVCHFIPVGRTNASRQPGGMTLYREIIKLDAAGENPRLLSFLLCANDHALQTRIQFSRNQLGSGSLAAMARRKARAQAARRAPP
jgi:hypothetical protein